MIEQFLKVANHRHFFDKHDKVLVAVSGGRDSMTLIHLLEACRDDLKIDLAIAHVHHGQRPEADQEVAYLEEYAKNRQFPFYLAYFQGVFSEKKARDFRYAFFKEIMEKEGYTALVTGHHADDQAETVFMRLLRGSRLFHLAGIKDKQAFGTGQLIRPLLTFKKEDFPPLTHFEDESNQSPIYLRNRIRHQYLPILSEENPRLAQALNRLSQEVDALYGALDYLTQDLDFKNLQVFRNLPQGLQVYLLEKELQNFPDLEIKALQFDNLLDLIRHKTNEVYPLKKDVRLVIDYNRFDIEKINPRSDEETKELVLYFGNQADFGSYQVSYGNPLDSFDYQVEVLDDSPVTLRYQKEGDRVLYRGYHRKLKRIYQEKKVSKKDRLGVVIVEQHQIILSLLGLITRDLSKSSKHDTIRNILYIKIK